MSTLKFFPPTETSGHALSPTKESISATRVRRPSGVGRSFEILKSPCFTIKFDVLEDVKGTRDVFLFDLQRSEGFL